MVDVTARALGASSQPKIGINNAEILLVLLYLEDKNACI
jgi:hypothetical protein